MSNANARGAAALLLAGSLSACAVASEAPSPETESGPPVATRTYLPGLDADVRFPEAAQPAAVPVVVLVPGGGWQTADRSGLSDLAAQLAANGFVTVNATYRSGADNATFPTPVDDVRCAVAFAVTRAEQAGVDVGPVIVVGHSSAGQLAALAALATPPVAGECPYDPPVVDGMVGLAGVYDIEQFEFALLDFFGAPRSEAPQVWAKGDPIGLVEAGQAPDDLSVLLLHGDADDLVPVTQSEDFAAALRSAGNDVELEVIPAGTHDTIYSAQSAAAEVTRWIRGL